VSDRLHRIRVAGPIGDTRSIRVAKKFPGGLRGGALSGGDFGEEGGLGDHPRVICAHLIELLGSG